MFQNIRKYSDISSYWVFSQSAHFWVKKPTWHGQMSSYRGHFYSAHFWVKNLLGTAKCHHMGAIYYSAHFWVRKPTWHGHLWSYSRSAPENWRQKLNLKNVFFEKIKIKLAKLGPARGLTARTYGEQNIHRYVELGILGVQSG